MWSSENPDTSNDTETNGKELEHGWGPQAKAGGQEARECAIASPNWRDNLKDRMRESRSEERKETVQPSKQRGNWDRRRFPPKKVSLGDRIWGEDRGG